MNNLKEKLNKANKIIETQQKKIKELENELNIKRNNNNYNNKINILEKQIKEKDEELKKLKIEIQNKNNPEKKQLYSLDDIVIVNFTSTDQIIHLSLKCIKTEIFAHIEEKLYKEYPDYKETNNYFLSQGKQILRFKTIEENNIKDGYTIMLLKPSENE